MSNTIHIPKGFKYCGKHVGIKFKNLDLGLVYSPTVCHASSVFTKNTFCGVSIPVGRENISNNELQAVVVTSGVANVATGEEGLQNTYTIIEKVGEELGIDKMNVLPSSTGIIGQQLPIDKVISGLDNISEEMSEENWELFAKAIITTDLKIKVRSVKVGNATILGIAKGSGMIEPNMATMLAYFFTDAFIPKTEVHNVLKTAVDLSFNMISVDSDTSTSDTVALLANGEAGEVNLEEFQSAFNQICIDLAKSVVMDGEGATKLIEVNVNQCRTFEQAKTIAKSIVNSPLVKTAVYGADPNWGRVVMAVGKTYDADVDPEKLEIYFGPYLIYERGIIHTQLTTEIQSYLKETDVCNIVVNMQLGEATATVWGCDLTEEYIKINALYTT